MEIAGPAIPAVACLAVFTTLSFITVCMRMYTRLFLVKNPGPDDFLIVGSMVIGLFQEFYSAANGP
jgi:hypothetical protein